MILKQVNHSLSCILQSKGIPVQPDGIEKSANAYKMFGGFFIPIDYLDPSCQNATALAAATFKESTPCVIGIFTV